MDVVKQITEEFKLRDEHVQNIIQLLDEGNTIPFIARYRKEMTGHIDDQVLRDFADRLNYLRNLNKEKEKVEKVIKEQDKWTEEIEKALADALTLTEEQSIKQFFETTTGKRILSLTGSTLDEVLYFVYKGTPVIAMKNEKEAVVIIGYTSSNVILYEDGKTKTVSLSNAETMFLEAGSIFFTYKE